MDDPIPVTQWPTSPARDDESPRRRHILPMLAVTALPAATNSTSKVDIRDLKPLVEIPNHWVWAAWTLGALALAALAYWAWRRHQRKLAQPQPEIVIPPHVRARERLRAALDLLQQPEPFCVLVSDTIRVYLEERFNFRAPERTTEEFLEELQASALLALSQKRGLADFLLRCDLVKFARYEPGEPELRELYEAALRLVEETEPPPAAPSLAEMAGASAPTSSPPADAVA